MTDTRKVAGIICIQNAQNIPISVILVAYLFGRPSTDPAFPKGRKKNLQGQDMAWTVEPFVAFTPAWSPWSRMQGALHVVVPSGPFPRNTRRSQQSLAQKIRLWRCSMVNLWLIYALINRKNPAFQKWTKQHDGWWMSISKRKHTVHLLCFAKRNMGASNKLHHDTPTKHIRKLT